MEYSSSMDSISSVGHGHLSTPSPAPPPAEQVQEPSTEAERSVQNDTGSMGTTSPKADIENQIDFFA